MKSFYENADEDIEFADEQEKQYFWGGSLIGDLVEVLGVAGDPNQVDSVVIRFLTNEAATVLIDGADEVELPLEGITPVKNLLGLPHDAIELEVSVKRDEFVIFTYTFSSIEDGVYESFLKFLGQKDE